MIKKILQKFTSTHEKRRLLENYLSLSVLQVTNYLLPLMTFPYLTRVLGAEEFGLLAFAQAFIQYFIVFTDYGFGLSATREIALCRDNKDKMSKIFSVVFVIKCFFMVIGFIIVILITNLIQNFKDNWVVYILTYGLIFDSVFFPAWFFQGIEEMKYIAIRNISTKTFFTLLIFVCVKNKEHFYLVPLINSVGALITGIYSIVFIKKKFGIRIVAPNKQDIISCLQDGWNIFISFLFINLYTSSNIFILGLVAPKAVVGYYSAGEKIIRIIISLFRPFSQALFPYFTKKAQESGDNTINLLIKIVILTVGLTIPMAIVIFIFAPQITLLILGKKFCESIKFLRLLSPLLIIIPLASVFSILWMLPFKLDKYFSKLYMGGALINFCFVFLFIFLFSYGAVGIGLSNLLTETILTCGMVYIIYKHSFIEKIKDKINILPAKPEA